MSEKYIEYRPLLIKARTKARLTTQELASKVGVDNSLIFRLEHSDKAASVEIWRRIQEALSLKDKDMWLIINTIERTKR